MDDGPIITTFITPTNAFKNGRPQYVSQNQDNKLFVIWYGQWVTFSGKTISSAAAGDMNPASQRNKWCDKCSYYGSIIHGPEVTL